MSRLDKENGSLKNLFMAELLGKMGASTLNPSSSNKKSTKNESIFYFNFPLKFGNNPLIVVKI